MQDNYFKALEMYNLNKIEIANLEVLIMLTIWL